MIEYIQSIFGDGFISGVILGLIVGGLCATTEIIIKTLILGKDFQSVMDRAEKNCLKELWVSFVIAIGIAMLVM